MTEQTELKKSINGRKWYADGTFCPITRLDHCTQIYIISIKSEHENYKKTTSPVAFVLLFEFKGYFGYGLLDIFSRLKFSIMMTKIMKVDVKVILKRSKRR